MHESLGRKVATDSNYDDDADDGDDYEDDDAADDDDDYDEDVIFVKLTIMKPYLTREVK